MPSFSRLFAIAALVFPSCGYAQHANDLFSRIFNRDTVEAEQILSVTVPKGSDPIHSRFTSLFKSASMTGELPAEFTPQNGQAFPIKTILIAPEESDIATEGPLDPSIEKVVRVNLNGKEYYRLFVHPLEWEKWRERAARGPKDPVQWIATPTSSSRSLLVSDKDQKFPLFVAKTSLNYTLAGGNRLIGEVRAYRAVLVNDAYREMMAETKGIIPGTNKTWSYFSETISVGAKENKDAYTIMRGLPADAHETIYLPFFALIGEREGKDRWIDELYKASGYTDKLDFVWKEIAIPMLQFHSMIHVDHGLVSELHQQNAMIKIDPKTKRILGFATRDMDGQSVDYLARKHFLGLSTPNEALTTEAIRTYGYHYAKGSPMLGYEYMKDSIFKHLFSFILTPDEVDRVVGGGNEFMLKRFNQRYSKYIGETKDFLSITDAYQKLYALKMTDDEKTLFHEQEALESGQLSRTYRWSSWLQFKYYLLKQRFEKTGASPDANRCEFVFTGGR